MKKSGRSRERILLYGREGCGKTTAALQVAAEVAKTNQVWVLSNDNSIERLCETDFEGVFQEGDYGRGDDVTEGPGNFHVYNVSTWPQYRDRMMAIWEDPRVDPDDLIIVDNMTWPWDTVKTWYVEITHGTDQASWSQMYRDKLDSAKGHTAQESIFDDWSFINAQWYGLHSERLVLPPCHLILTANAKEMRTDGRVDKGLKDLYAGLGMAPDSQKRVGATAQTILHLHSTKNSYYITSAKDRGRDQLEQESWEDFPQTYLADVAGWTTKKAGFGNGSK